MVLANPMYSIYPRVYYSKRTILSYERPCVLCTTFPFIALARFYNGGLLICLFKPNCPFFIITYGVVFTALVPPFTSTV